ncbi:MAG: hypothetical protein Q8P67_12530, partial [archaeon]|nr:hypothetical protein [archaeon]
LLSDTTMVEVPDSGTLSTHRLDTLLGVRDATLPEHGHAPLLQIEFSSGLLEFLVDDPEALGTLSSALRKAQLATAPQQTEQPRKKCNACGATIEAGFRVTCPKCFEILTPDTMSPSSSMASGMASGPATGSTTSSASTANSAEKPSLSLLGFTDLSSMSLQPPSFNPPPLLAPQPRSPVKISEAQLEVPKPSSSMAIPTAGRNALSSSPIGTLTPLGSSLDPSMASHSSSFVDRLYSKGGAEQKNDVTDIPPEVYSGDIDENLLIHLQIKFLHQNNRHEEFVCIIRSSFLPYRASLSEEKTGFILLGVNNLYILQRAKKVSLSGPSEFEFSLCAQLSLESLQMIVAGLFMQYFRLEFASRELRAAYVFLPRAHSRTHRFLMTLSRLSLSKIVNYNAQSLQSMHTSFLHNHKHTFSLVRHEQLSAQPSFPPVSCVLLGFLRIRSVDPREKGFYSPQHGNLVPRTLVMSQQWLFLAIEDYGNYPLHPQARPPPTSHYTMVAHDSIQNIQAIEIDRDDPRTLTIVFEDEATADTHTWNLLMQSPDQKSYGVKILSQLYYNIFQCQILTLTKE